MSEGNGNFPALRGKIRASGIDFPEDTTYEEWQSTGQVLLWLHSWTPWALVDWWEFGSRKFGMTAVQAADITGKAVKTIYNISYLGRQFPPELRSEVLDPGHHEVLVGMEPQEKRHWLAEGERLDKESNGHLTVQAFREHVREHRREPAELGAKVEKARVRTCSACAGSGTCSACGGHGEVPDNGKGVR